MTKTRVTRKFLADYQPPAYLIDAVDLSFDIRATHTDVCAVYSVRRNPAAAAGAAPMQLDGRSMALRRVAMDGRELAGDEYRQDDHSLVIEQPPQAFSLRIENRIDPEHNLALEGLYRSGDILCTQCEARGFSRITYFPDRPDVMARYTTRIEADKVTHPVLLSNGNCIASGDVDDERHYAVYQDPYAKPCYLFALVAGDLGMIRDSYTTLSGREIDLRLYTERGNEAQCQHAMASLKQAMAWDEQTFGLEYDLASHVAVAVGSFNMGAMENKGLNIFNTACILAHKDTATDADFALVRDVVAHEYFHNYTGNRVTCRDWFQLSLKEGLTVFREHAFAIEHGSPGATRIAQVRLLRDLQFPEDAGPRAHPVRPESYVQMDNFYTITIYHKGAELIRMQAQLAGWKAFVKAVRHYLHKHDGEAVTIEDFVVAMEESTGLDLQQFRLWYTQAGTPTVSVQPTYDEAHERLQLKLTQHTPATPGQAHKQALDLPLRVALLGADGRRLAEPALLRLNQPQQEWTFDHVSQRPTLSLLRGFTAPVKLDYAYSDAELARLMAHDDDAVARWDAAQQLYLQTLVADARARSSGAPAIAAGAALLDAIDTLLQEPPGDRALLAEMLTLPSAARIGEQFVRMDMHAIVAARAALRQQIATQFGDRLEALADAHMASGGYEFTPREAGRRRVLGVSLSLLAALGLERSGARAQHLYQNADNMTERMHALRALNDLPGKLRHDLMADFAQQWTAYPLVMDKWLQLQASARRPDALAVIEELLADERFDFTNPNRIRALLAGFARGNLPAFHQADGSGYRLLGREIERIDAFNPQMSASLAGLMTAWRRHVPAQAQPMRAELKRLAGQDLPANAKEILAVALADPS
ncbi:MAG TPA: aminopeptidase N [Salinisphaeraceae bacterium]|nr:aminopeptidase N [Salinisphaeraceae bacterium]